MNTSSAYAKPHWWGPNVEFIREYAPHDNGKLRHSYVEMAGETVHNMYARLLPTLPDPSYFIAVDRDAPIVFRHILNHREFRLVYGDFFTVANREIAREGGPRAAVFNYDGTAWAGHPTWWAKDGRNLRETVTRSVEANGVAVVILNLALTRRGDTNDRKPVHLMQHTEEFLRLFREWPVDKREIYNGEVPKDGRAGAYQIYQSEGRIYEMATLRVAFGKKGEKLRVHNRCKF